MNDREGEGGASDAETVLGMVRRAAYVFYVDGRWRPFPAEKSESRVTKPDEATHVQFNYFPRRGAGAEYRGPCGRWWVRIDPETGMPVGDPTFVPSVTESGHFVH